ncbi:OmpA family protein [Chitinophaga niabensis]|uniref:OmpA family protein n=1 Tax=Chitinophaga niabensis TaxID=536979 RepID=A0A1N6KCN0_9BACT|nr:OmpA family protein [Chitinophaga niabensis]SIO54334.1 OmpA family protein [Chitinophaga niabensis]
MYLRILTIAASATVLLACNSGKKGNTTDSTNTTTTTENTTPAAPEAATPVAKGFDLNAIPVSDKPLGAFPYFELPEGYYNFNKNKIADYDVAYFWVKDHFEKPEGKIFYDYIRAKEGKSYSDLELTKNLDAVITGAGGVKVSEMKVPQDSASVIPENNRLKYMTGYGFIANAVTTTYLIRRADKNIWVQFTPSDDGSSICWMVLETKALKITASLTKAEEMKSELDSKGHIALYINFDTDKANIKAESQPTIDEIQKLLSTNAGLKVAIEGHTDNSGTAARNKKLSEERAQAVKAALTAKGIDAGRLTAKGIGQDKPIADNASEEGKAKNRRVEIVKI